MFEKGEYFFTFDLKLGYHHVDIHVDFWPHLGFSWGVHTTRKFYMFKVLPFGLASACYVFTKLLRPFVKKWRSEGIRAIVYMDTEARGFKYGFPFTIPQAEECLDEEGIHYLHVRRMHW